MGTRTGNFIAFMQIGNRVHSDVVIAAKSREIKAVLVRKERDSMPLERLIEEVLMQAIGSGEVV